MKEEKMLRAFSLVDDDLVENAAPKQKKPKLPFWWKRLAYIAVAACLMLVILLPVMFGGGHESVPVPTTDVSTHPSAPMQTSADTTQGAPAIQPTAPVTTVAADAGPPGPLDAYKDSEYFPLIERLDAYYQYLDELKTANSSPVMNAPSEPPLGNETPLPDDITDNQVEGVIEGDLIKRTETHLFHAGAWSLRIYTIAGLDSECVGSYEIKNGTIKEFHLLDGGKRALLLYSFASDVYLVLLDLQDYADIKELHTLQVRGSLDATRVSENGILLFTSYTVRRQSSNDRINFSYPDTFVPKVIYDKGYSYLFPMEDIVLPVAITATSLRYNMVFLLDADTLEPQGRKLFLGDQADLSVSKEHVFISMPRQEKFIENDDFRTVQNVSDIYCLSYQDGELIQKGMITLQGTTKDQFSFDEKDGILRVVTEIDFSSRSIKDNGISDTYIGASLYCVSLDSFEIVAKVERFAPHREAVQSVRFDGDYAYVCTALKQATPLDPVFFFDLSDLSNITYTDTGTIDGFSFSLIQFGNGHLLGIGYEDLETAKIEVYREEGDKVVSVDKYLLPDTELSQDYKLYYIDRENQILGFTAYTLGEEYALTESWTHYFLFHFDGEKLVEVLCLEQNGAFPYFRSVIIDGYLYLFSNKEFKVLEVNL